MVQVGRFASSLRQKLRTNGATEEVGKKKSSALWDSRAEPPGLRGDEGSW